MLLFGDRQRKFYDKSKEYYWEGLNRLVMKELRYMEDKTLAEKIRKSKCVSPCMACNGALLSKTYRNLDRSAVGYKQFMRCSFIDLLKGIEFADPTQIGLAMRQQWPTSCQSLIDLDLRSIF